MENLIVSSEDSSIRIDKYLTINTDFTRSKIEKLIKNNNILINDKEIKKSYTVKENDIICIKDYEEEETNIIPQNIKLDIVYEDEYLLVVNKPSGMVVHPAVGNKKDTLVNALLYHCKTLSNNDIRPGIVHRIDKDTSGLLMIAKNDFVHNHLSNQLKEKTTKRIYTTLVWGVINHDTGTIDAPIGRSLTNRQKMSVTDINSKEAITNFKVLERFKNTTLIECILETGRTHQIRVHLDYINHPVVNDKVYGKKTIIDEDFGQMLHAKTLGFIHPITNEYLEFNSDLPNKFIEILNIFKDK